MDLKMRKAVIPLTFFVVGGISGGIGMWSTHHIHPKKALPLPTTPSRPKQVTRSMKSLLEATLKEVEEAENDSIWTPFMEEGDDIAVDDSGKDIVYRVPIENIKEKQLKVDVQEGVVTVTTRSQHSEELKGENSKTMTREEFMTNYQKTFPLVAGANPAKMDYAIEQDTLVIRFPKLKGV